MEELNKDKIKLRSNAISEIISRPPGALVRWGLCIVAFVFAVILMLTILIRYPDILQSDVTLTTYPAPSNLIVRLSGRLKLLKQDGSHVSNGEPIAYIVSNAKPNDVLLLDSLIRNDPQHVMTLAGLQLGEIQTYANNYIERAIDFRTFVNAHLTKIQLAHLRKQASHVQNLNANLRDQLLLMTTEVEIANEKYTMDSVLFSQGVISRIDFNNSRLNFVAQQRAFKSLSGSIINNHLQLDELEKQGTELEVAEITHVNQLKITLENAVQELGVEIDKWKQQYLFTSTFDGTLVFPDFIEDQQFVEAGEALFSVIPDRGDVFGHLTVPITGSGKVKPGQDVNVKLSNYPAEQFGMLHGRVDHISLLPNGENYSVRISFPDGMKTSYNQRLPFQQQLKGHGEIITEDISLFQRIFYQFNNLTMRMRVNN
jgi:hypothetical protein